MSLKTFIVFSLSLLISIRCSAGLTAEQVLGDYWNDPLFGQAASEASYTVELLNGKMWPQEMIVPVDTVIQLMFVNQSNDLHILLISGDIEDQEKSEDFIMDIQDQLDHYHNKIYDSRGHSHSGSEMDATKSIVKTVSEKPTVLVPSADRKELLFRFDEPGVYFYKCVIAAHKHSDKGKLIVE